MSESNNFETVFPELFFTISEIEKAFEEDAVIFERRGSCNIDEEYNFVSLRSPKECGIYYVVGDIDLPQAISRSIVICESPDVCPEGTGNTYYCVSNAQLVYYQLMNTLIPRPDVKGIHPSAVVDPGAIIDPSSWIGPFCVIGKCKIGANVVLHSHVVIFDNCIIEDGVRIEPHSTIGATGVAWIWNPNTGERIIQPQLGGVIIGRNSFIGSDVSVVRGSVNETTQIGNDCMIAHGSKIGHGSRISDHTHFANNVTLAGNVDVGQRCFLGSGCVIRPRVTIASGTIVGAGAVVVRDINSCGTTVIGVPAKPVKDSNLSPSGVPKPFFEGANND